VPGEFARGDALVFRSSAVFAPQEGKVPTARYLSAALTVLGPSLRYVSQWHDQLRGHQLDQLVQPRDDLFQPAVVGVGAGDETAGDVGPAGAVAAGLVSASAVVVTGPAELPFSQADQDSCQ
jgi:hypothetical protein